MPRLAPPSWSGSAAPTPTPSTLTRLPPDQLREDARPNTNAGVPARALIVSLIATCATERGTGSPNAVSDRSRDPAFPRREEPS